MLFLSENKKMIAHTTPEFVNFATEKLQCPDFQYMKTATYTSPQAVNDCMDVMMNVISDRVNDRISKSPGYAIKNEETTDFTNKKHLAFCIYSISTKRAANHVLTF